jgi:hypothetical protein
MLDTCCWTAKRLPPATQANESERKLSPLYHAHTFRPSSHKTIEATRFYKIMALEKRLGLQDLKLTFEYVEATL